LLVHVKGKKPDRDGKSRCTSNSLRVQQFEGGLKRSEGKGEKSGGRCILEGKVSSAVARGGKKKGKKKTEV